MHCIILFEVLLFSEATIECFLSKKLFLKISQNSEENICAGVFSKVAGLKRLLHRCFPVNFMKVLRIYFLEHLPTAASVFIIY